MKKLFVTMLATLACGGAYALPVGNPSAASLIGDGIIYEGRYGKVCEPCLNFCDAFSFRTGFYGDYVFNRHLKIDERDGDGLVEKTRLFTNAAYVAANLWDRFDVFATLGGTNFWIDTNASAFGGTNGERIRIESDTDFSWGLGARATLLEIGCTSIGAEGQYFYAHPHIHRITVTESPFVSIYPNDILDTKYREWQFGLGVSHRINIFVPYVAVKWSRVEARSDDAFFEEFSPTIHVFDLENQKHWGYAVGVSLVDCEKAALNVEARFGDEKAVHVNGQFRF